MTPGLAQSLPYSSVKLVQVSAMMGDEGEGEFIPVELVFRQLGTLEVKHLPLTCSLSFHIGEEILANSGCSRNLGPGSGG